MTGGDAREPNDLKSPNKTIDVQMKDNIRTLPIKVLPNFTLDFERDSIGYYAGRILIDKIGFDHETYDIDLVDEIHDEIHAKYSNDLVDTFHPTRLDNRFDDKLWTKSEMKRNGR